MTPSVWQGQISRLTRKCAVSHTIVALTSTVLRLYSGIQWTLVSSPPAELTISWRYGTLILWRFWCNVYAFVCPFVCLSPSLSIFLCPCLAGWLTDWLSLSLSLPPSLSPSLPLQVKSDAPACLPHHIWSSMLYTVFGKDESFLREEIWTEPKQACFSHVAQLLKRWCISCSSQ